MYPLEYQSQYASPARQDEPKGLAITSMVLGIVSLVIPFVGLLTAILAIIFGAVSRSHNEGGRGMAIAGIVCGIIALVGGIVIIILIAVAASTPS